MPDEKIDQLLELFRAHSQEDMDRLEKIHDAIEKHGTLLARIDERTQQHEKRLDSVDRKTVGISTITGTLGGVITIFLKSLIGLEK